MYLNLLKYKQNVVHGDYTLNLANFFLAKKKITFMCDITAMSRIEGVDLKSAIIMQKIIYEHKKIKYIHKICEN